MLIVKFRQIIKYFDYILNLVMKMRVKIFDESHEKDLEEDINEFFEEFDGELVDIKYEVSSCIFGEEQIYCFSAMIIYES